MNRIVCKVLGVCIGAPIGALLAYRIGTAAMKMWKRRMERKMTATTTTADISDWEKLKRGETRNGFRVCQLHENESMENENDDWRVTCRVIIEPPWPKYDDDDDEEFEKWIGENEPLTVFGLVGYRRPNKSPDDGMLVLRRYSIVDPNVYEDIARIVYERKDQENHRGWSCMSCEQLNECTVAVRFVHSGNAADRIILIDTQNRSYRQFEFPPSGKMMHLRIFLDEYRRDRFSVLYADVGCPSVRHPSKFVNIEYEIEQSQQDSTFFATVRRSGIRCVAFSEDADIDCHFMLCQQIGMVRIPGVFFVFSLIGDEDFPGQAFVFDHRGQCRKICDLDEWHSRHLHENSVGRRLIFDVSEHFNELVASATHQGEEGGEDKPSILTIYYGDIFGSIKDEAMIQLHIRPPSMIRQTAEAIRRSIPISDHFPSVVKNETGVDIFDGILDEEKKKPILMIRLDLIDDNEAMIGLAGIVGL